MNETRKRILHIEDDADFQNFIGLILADLAEITAVQTLREARAQIHDTTFDLFLVDFMLPDGSGSELIVELSSQYSSIPIIVFSAHEITSTMKNVSEVFVKGRFSEQDLVEAVRALLS